MQVRFLPVICTPLYYVCSASHSPPTWQSLGWFNESFLCFRFGQLLSCAANRQLHNRADATVASAFAMLHGSVEQPQHLPPLHPKLAEFLRPNGAPLKFELIDLNGQRSFGSTCEPQSTSSFAAHTTSEPKESGTNQTPARDRFGGSNLDDVDDDDDYDDEKQRTTKATSRMLRVELSRPTNTSDASAANGVADNQTNNYLSLECDSADLMSELVRSFVIDRLHFGLSVDEFQRGELVADCTGLLHELDMINNESKQLEDTERRIQAELYEFAEHTGNLMQQFAIAIHLDEL